MGGDGNVEDWFENGIEVLVPSTAGRGCFEGAVGGGGGALVGARLKVVVMSTGKFLAKAGNEDGS